MVKAYLRYSHERSVGVITSRECNVVADKSGRYALAGSGDSVSVWNIRQGALARTLKTAKAAERVTRLCVKGGERPVVAVGYGDGAVRLWDFERGAELQTLQGHRSAVSCLAFERSGHLLASGACDTDIVLWDITAESGVARLRGHVDQVTAVLFWEGPEQAEEGAVASRVISASKDRFVRIWSVELQICLQTISEHQAEVWSLALNGSQTRLVAGSADKFLRVWSLNREGDVSAGEELATFIGAIPRPDGQGSAVGLQFCRPKGVNLEVLLCQGAGKTVEVFRSFGDSDVKKRQRRRKKRVELKTKKKGEAAKAAEAADADEGDEAEEGADDDQTTRAADELALVKTHRCGAKAVSMDCCAATGSVLVGLTNNAIEAVQLKAAEGTGVDLEDSPGIEAPGHRTAVRALAVSHDDSLLMSASAECMKVWNTQTGRVVRTITTGYGLCAFFVPGNEHILLGTKEGKLELYDLRVAEAAQELEAHAGAVYGLAERPDKKGFASCSADKMLRVFDFTFAKKSKSETVSFAESPGDLALELPDECMAVAYSPNGKWICVGLLNHTVQLLFADSMKFYVSLYGHRLPIMCLDVSSDSQLVASGSADKNVKLWSTHFGNCLRSLRAHDDSVMLVRFLPGTHYLASAGRDRDLKLWDCDSYELITALKGHGSEILSLAISQDASFIATAGGDKQIRVWRRGSEQLFLSEERALELDEKFEQEAEREDLPGPGAEVVSLRPSRRTIESVRTTERLMEILDEATAAEAEGGLMSARPPCVQVVAYVNTLTASNIYEVLLAMPFSHAFKLVGFICRFLEAVSALPAHAAGGGKGKEGVAVQSQVLSAATMLETPCQAALITAYIHHNELAATPSARPLLLRLRQQMRSLLQAQKDRVGLSTAGFAHLRRVIRTSSGTAMKEVLAAGAAKAAGEPAPRPSSGGPAKRRKKK
mmetsp:Transcript_14382/g.42988  ORF Transcript_14382/g.42988 Transcript_14382/m.42988 type:complete len:940 (-) Transcript_14382:73-2892(-)